MELKASGVAGFFALFAGLCAIFAGCVTLSDWYSEITQARRWVVSTTPHHLPTDIILLAIAIVACIVSLELAKRLKAREAVRAAPDNDGSQNRLVGLLFAAMGLFLTGSVMYRAIHTHALTLDSLMGVPANLMFVFAGILLGLPTEYAKWRAFLATLVITCFAMTSDWVAFIPGERKFSGSFLGISVTPSASFGRATFGVCAIILDVCAAAMWIRLLTGRAEDRSTRGA